MKPLARLEALMQKYTEADGVPGFEAELRAMLKEDIQPYAEEILTDRLGGVVGKKTGDEKGPRILIAGHMDEIGFMVTGITKNGFLRFQPLGGWWAPDLLAQRVKVKTREQEYWGIIATKSIYASPREDRKKGIDLSDLFIDVGAKSDKEVGEMGIRLGDPVIPVAEFFTMRNGAWWCGKALDNRMGCVMALEVLRRLNEEAHPNIVYAGATVQEEVGVRGSGTLAHVAKPNVAIALDISLSYDTPGLESLNNDSKLDGGPLLFLKDARLIGHVQLRYLFMDTAEELGIPLQLEALQTGGTDGGGFQLYKSGCPTLSFGVPVRYLHTHYGVMSRSDFEQAVELLVAVIKKLDWNAVEELLGE